MLADKSLARVFATGILVFTLLTCASGQTKWYKFNKDFIDSHYAADSAIGTLKSSDAHPAKNVHSTNCGGNDGELHVGIAGKEISWNNLKQLPVSTLANDDNAFGIVAEPVNVSSGTQSMITDSEGQTSSFVGYFRVWNEGHDSGNEFPSNPHHVLELHPAWAFDSGQHHFDKPTTIFAMPGYHGYGATKFKPVLQSAIADEWPKVYEDSDFVYVQIMKAENFYQLPVTIKSINSVSGGKQAQVDVYSDAGHKKLVYKDLSVVAANGAAIAGKLVAGKKTFLLGIFSVNLRKAMALAVGKKGEAEAAFAPAALEFFVYGIPKEKAVASSSSTLCKSDPTD